MTITTIATGYIAIVRCRIIYAISSIRIIDATCERYAQ
jgi:hypothetical protein